MSRGGGEENLSVSVYMCAHKSYPDRLKHMGQYSVKPLLPTLLNVPIFGCKCFQKVLLSNNSSAGSRRNVLK